MNAIQTSDETRSLILDEAERLFRHYGYSKTTVADIAEACRMSSANVYRFFASKSEINEGVANRLMSQLEAQLQKIVKEDAPASERLSRFIECVALNTAEIYIHDKKAHEMVIVALDEQWDAIKRHLQATRVLLHEIILEGIASGEFQPQDAWLAARCVHVGIAAYKHPVMAAQCRDDPDMPQPAEMAAFFLSALKA